MIRVATWCAMMWDGVESACYHRARGGLVRVCVCVRVVGRARGRKNQMKKSLCVWDSCATRERERERDGGGE